jgi:hypothetical protein
MHFQVKKDNRLGVHVPKDGMGGISSGTSALDTTPNSSLKNAGGIEQDATLVSNGNIYDGSQKSRSTGFSYSFRAVLLTDLTAAGRFSPSTTNVRGYDQIQFAAHSFLKIPRHNR